MRIRDYRRLENYMLRYYGMLIKLCLNQEQPVLIRMKRKINRKGLCTTFTFEIKMRCGDTRREVLKVWGANYLWLLTSVAADFPNCEFIDCTAPELQVVNHTDNYEGGADEKGQ